MPCPESPQHVVTVAHVLFHSCAKSGVFVLGEPWALMAVLLCFSATTASTHMRALQAGEIRKGSHLMIKGRPCKCIEVSTSKTGKHGHAKAHIVAIDIFTGKKMEDLCPTSHNLDVPFVKKTEYQLLTADADTGEVSLLQENGDTKVRCVQGGSSRDSL